MDTRGFWFIIVVVFFGVIILGVFCLQEGKKVESKWEVPVSVVEERPSDTWWMEKHHLSLGVTVYVIDNGETRWTVLDTGGSAFVLKTEASALGTP